MARTPLEFSVTALSQQLCATCYIAGAQDSHDSKWIFCDRYANTDINRWEQFQHYKDCACTYSLVVFNWHDDGVCAILVSLNFILIMKYWVQVTWSFIPTFCNAFLNSKHCLIASQFISDSGYYNFGLCGLLYYGWTYVFLFFCSPRMILKPCSSSLCKCNACTVCFFSTMLLSRPITYFQSCCEG